MADDGCRQAAAKCCQTMADQRGHHHLRNAESPQHPDQRGLVFMRCDSGGLDARCQRPKRQRWSAQVVVQCQCLARATACAVAVCHQCDVAEGVAARHHVFDEILHAAAPTVQYMQHHRACIASHGSRNAAIQCLDALAQYVDGGRRRLRVVICGRGDNVEAVERGGLQTRRQFAVFQFRGKVGQRLGAPQAAGRKPGACGNGLMLGEHEHAGIGIVHLFRALQPVERIQCRHGIGEREDCIEIQVARRAKAWPPSLWQLCVLCQQHDVALRMGPGTGLQCGPGRHAGLGLEMLHTVGYAGFCRGRRGRHGAGGMQAEDGRQKGRWGQRTTERLGPRQKVCNYPFKRPGIARRLRYTVYRFVP